MSVVPSLSGIYSITHLPSGRYYIGSAVNLRARWHLHKTNLRAGKHHSQRLQDAWDADGPDAFALSVIEYVDDRKKLIEREQHWLDSLCAAYPERGFNICPVASSLLGIKRNPEAVEKTAAAKRGVKRTPEQRARMVEAWKVRHLTFVPKPSKRTPGRLRAHTPEQRQLAAEKQRGRTRSAETRAKMSAAHKGRVKSEAERLNLRKAAKGRTITSEWRAKIGAAHKGRTLTAEHIEKMRSGMKASHARKRAAAEQSDLLLHAHGND